MRTFETLVDIYTHAIESFCDEPLFGANRAGQWRWMTYREFGKATDAFRAGLAGLGLERGSRIGIIAKNRPEWAIAAYACFGLGAAFVPMYEAQSPEEWEFIIADCDVTAVIVATDAIAERITKLFDRIPSLRHVISMATETATNDRVHSFAELSATTSEAPTATVEPRDIAAFIYTSGTTHQPKGVILSHRNIASAVNGMRARFPVSTADRAVSVLPWAHSFARAIELHGFFAMGASMAICEGPHEILDTLRETKPTLLCGVPSVYMKLYAAVQNHLSSRPAPVRSMVTRAVATRRELRVGGAVSVRARLALSIVDRLVLRDLRRRFFGGRIRIAICGAAATAPDLADFIDGLGIPVYETYGLTETSNVAENLPNDRKMGSVGKLTPGVTVKISEEQEIIVYGPGVMLGYHKNDEANEAAFDRDGGFRTGDMGRLDDDGFLFITGRLKEQYKLSNGKYVVPTALEEHYRLSRYIANIMVHGANKSYNVALVVVDIDALRSWAEENGMSGEPIETLLASQKVHRLFDEELARFGDRMRSFERVKNFALIVEDFTVENGLATSIVKLKRRAIYTKYSSVIENLYATNERPCAEQAAGRSPTQTGPEARTRGTG